FSPNGGRSQSDGACKIPHGRIAAEPGWGAARGRPPGRRRGSRLDARRGRLGAARARRRLLLAGGSGERRWQLRPCRGEGHSEPGGRELRGGLEQLGPGRGRLGRLRPAVRRPWAPSWRGTPGEPSLGALPVAAAAHLVWRFIVGNVVEWHWRTLPWHHR
ncbi:unnamed protein product, partial [Prorocentrum cordatum]